MQDRIIGKKQRSSLSEDRTADALAALQRRETERSDSTVRQNGAVDYRKLARPRSEAYLRLVAQQIQISKRLNQLYLRQQGCVGPKKGNSGGNTISDIVQNPENGAGGAEALSGTVGAEECAEKTAEEKSVKEAGEEVAEKTAEEKDAIEKEIRQLQEELTRIQAEVETEMPVGLARLGYLYGSDKEERLIYMGVISGRGKECNDVQELLENIGWMAEQEKKQWVKAYEILMGINVQCLVVEVYLTVICVVYEDGSVSCYRDE